MGKREYCVDCRVTVARLHRHRVERHTAKTFVLECHRCGHHEIRDEMMARHYEVVHRSSIRGQAIQTLSVPVPLFRYLGRCDRCQYKSAYPQHLETHMWAVHEVRPPGAPDATCETTPGTTTQSTETPEGSASQREAPGSPVEVITEPATTPEVIIEPAATPEVITEPATTSKANAKPIVHRGKSVTFSVVPRPTPPAAREAKTPAPTLIPAGAEATFASRDVRVLRGQVFTQDKVNPPRRPSATLDRPAGLAMPRPAVSALKRELSPKGTQAVNQVAEGLGAMGLDLGPDVKRKEGSPPTPEDTEPVRKVPKKITGHLYTEDGVWVGKIGLMGELADGDLVVQCRSGPRVEGWMVCPPK